MLTDLACRKAAPQAKEYRLADALGMYLLVKPTGHRSWRLGYWFAGQKKRLVLGSYPEMTLQEAREARDHARRLIAQGTDPAVRRKQDKASRIAVARATFKAVAEQFLDERKPLWAASYAATVERTFKNHLYPQWGSLSFAEITRPMIVERLKAIEAKGVRETALRARQKVNELREWAQDLGYAVHSAGEVKAGLRGAIVTKRPAITDLEALRTMLRRIEQAPAHPITRLCSRFIALTVVRPGTAQLTPWSELLALDELKPTWVIPAARMKLTQERKRLDSFDHHVPLARQTVELLEVLATATGKSTLAFPSMSSSKKAISDSTVSKLYRDNGARDLHVPHGWRSSFSTIMNERAMLADRAGDRVVIDLMLAHVQDGVEPTYNRAAYMERRRELAQEWADLLLKDMPPAAELLLGPRR